MTMRTILQALLTVAVIVHFSGVIAFGVVELRRRWRRLTQRDGAEADDADEREDELASLRRRRSSAETTGVGLLAALNHSRGADSRR
jgi:hypothetical protein